MFDILLVDVDSKIPNLALMKLSAHWKERGASVDLLRLKMTGYPKGPKTKPRTIDNSGYDKTFASNIFTANTDLFRFAKDEGVEAGGTGQNMGALPDEIDDAVEDYSIYPENRMGYGFLTRGCPRDCDFCGVTKKEGSKVYTYRTIDQVLHGFKRASFMDNNILALRGHMTILNDLVDRGLRCEFNQGIDFRLLNDENAAALGKLNYIREYIFAFDSVDFKDKIGKRMAIFQKYVGDPWRIKFYVLVGFDSTIGDDMVRINWLKERQMLPYVMRYQTCWDSRHRDFYIQLAAWCNQPSFFKRWTFLQFVEARLENKDMSAESYQRAVSSYKLNAISK